MAVRDSFSHEAGIEVRFAHEYMSECLPTMTLLLAVPKTTCDYAPRHQRY
jgi:hypothetical protein